MLVTERTEHRMGESIALTLTKPFQYLTPTLITTPIDTLAKSLLSATLYSEVDPKSKKPNVEIIDNCKIFDLAKIYDQNASS